MVSLTENERKATIILTKEFSEYYNANTLSKRLNISHVGTQKVLKRLLTENILISQTIGKAIIYKPNIKDDYVRKLIIFLLADEANNYKRWKEEFKDLFKKERIILIYGSAIKNYNASKDIDIMIVMKKNELNEINSVLKSKQSILPKKLHAIKLTKDDLLKNIKNKNAAILDAIKNAIVLYGQDEYLEVLENVTGF